MINFVQLNNEVMLDTKRCYESIDKLKKSICNSIKQQYMVAHKDKIDQPVTEHSNTKYFVSPKRTFEAAKAYQGKKVAVLNYANNHSVGGAPYYAGAQEESLCRCSTLLPCLQAMEREFYQKHINAYMKHEIGNLGNDDLIYTPDVVVFKTDERTIPVHPKMMPENEWYNVNVITCAAPELFKCYSIPENYSEIIESRIKKILDVAARERNEVLILGAWGCGAFGNSVEVVAGAFNKLLKNYNFEIVEFALSNQPSPTSPFVTLFGKCVN